MATTFKGRYVPTTPPVVHTREDLAHHWIAELNTATGKSDATAKWVGVPLGTGDVTAHVDQTVIHDGTVHIEVTAGADYDSTTTIAAAATTIADTAAAQHVDNNPLAVDGLTLNLHAGGGAAFLGHFGWEAGATTPWYLKIGTEVVKVTARSTDALTIVRAALNSTAAEQAANTVVHPHYAPTATSIKVVAAPQANGICPYTVIVGAEQLRVTAVTGTYLTVTREYDSTDALETGLAYNTAVTQYLDEDTTTIDVASGTPLAANTLFKVATGGTEIIKVTARNTNKLTIARGRYGSTAAVIVDGAAPFIIHGPAAFDTALTAVNAIADGKFDEGRYGTPLPSLRLPDLTTETIIEND
jgi:hypothetical protein